MSLQSSNKDEAKPLCSICTLNPFKYKCPACGSKTCSVECVKKHKIQYECSGKIDPTRYVPMNEIKDLDIKTDIGNEVNGQVDDHVNNIVVQRDYNFLLNLGRHIDLKKSDSFQSAKPLFQKRRLPSNNNNNRFKRARTGINYTMIKKGSVSILQMPLGMQRAKQNKTFFDKKSQRYLWTLELVFYISGTANDNGVSIILPKISETENLEKILTIANNRNPNSNNITHNFKLPELLNIKNCKHFFLKKIYDLNSEEHKTGTNPNRDLIAIANNSEDIGKKTLKDILAGQLVMEFPTIYVSNSYEIPKYRSIQNCSIAEYRGNYGSENNNDHNIVPEIDTKVSKKSMQVGSENIISEDKSQIKQIAIVKNNAGIINNATLSIAYNSDEDDEEDGVEGSAPIETSALPTGFTNK